MRRGLCTFVMCISAFFAAGKQTIAAENKLDGYSYMSLEGENEFYTRAPDAIKLGMIGGNDANRNHAFSALNILASFADTPVHPSHGSTVDFVGLFFGDNIITGKDIDFSQIPTISQDIETVELLKKSYQPGVGCVSSALYDKDGAFLRSAIVANMNVEQKKLLGCVLDVAAHIFGISTSQSDPGLAIEDKFATIGRMIGARNECLRAGDNTLSCAYSKLEK